MSRNGLGILILTIAALVFGVVGAWLQLTRVVGLGLALLALAALLLQIN